MKKVFIISAVFLLSSFQTLYAGEFYFGIGLGYQNDLGSLIDTIQKDGARSRVFYPSMQGAQLMTGCQGAGSACLNATGSRQKVIESEKDLVAMDRASFGTVHTEAGGLMRGLMGQAFLEKDWDYFFVRISFQYTQKVLGGQTTSSVLGIEWYNLKWDYHAINIPLNLALRVPFGESTAFYMGGGVNYSAGGWDVGGKNLGDIPTTLVGALPGVGPHGALTVRDPITGVAQGGGVYAEALKLHAVAFGLNFLTGIEKRLETGNKIFFEIDVLLTAKQSTTMLRSQGGINSLAPFAAYPVVLGGTRYTFGYKFAL